MRLILNVKERPENKFCKTGSELVNAVCGLIDTQFEVEYVDHELDSDEDLVDETFEE